MSKKLILEIAVQDSAGAQIARAGGADRIEVCAALGVTGGLTPSGGAMTQIVGQGISSHILVRPRPGSFVYTAAELDVMAQDIEACIAAGAKGIVIGALTEESLIDVVATKELVAVARAKAHGLGVSCEITFHRALDVTHDPVAALQALADLGVDRVLTSGGAPRSGEGLEVLAALCKAGTGVQVMAGGGVTVESIADLAAVGVDAVHLSAKALIPDRGPVGPGGGEAGDLEVTSPEIVAAAFEQVQLINTARASNN